MVSGQRKQPLAADIQIREHKLITGVNEKLGGQDEGPNPHELLEAALAGCTILTVQMYANRKGYKLESCDVEVKIEKEGPETFISRHVTFKGDLSDEEKARLTEIVEKCPIHKLLESKVTINTSVIK